MTQEQYERAVEISERLEKLDEVKKEIEISATLDRRDMIMREVIDAEIEELKKEIEQL